MEEILEKLKEVSRTMRPNLEKFDKSKYLKHNPTLYRKDNVLSSDLQCNIYTEKISNNNEK